jgi:tetratricopeptide (TPR) repeat protein
MTDIRKLKQELSRVYSLWADEHYDRALALVEKALKEWPGNAQLYVAWAGLVQLQEEPTHDLGEAKGALESAAAMDADSPAAAIELGHFLDAVEDNPRAASKAFAEGVARARRLLIDGLLGQARALLQLNKRKEATKCLIELLHLSNFGFSFPGAKSADADPDLVLRRPGGPVFEFQLRGSFAQAIESLLQDVLANKSA